MSRHDQLAALLEFPGQEPLAFSTPLHVLEATRLDDVRATIAAAERHALAGRWVVGWLSYEAAPAFDPALVVRDGGAGPLAWFAVFERPLAAPASDAPLPAPCEWTCDTTRDEHAERVSWLRAGLGRGDYYQVNLTLRLHARAASGGDAAWALHRRLRRVQPDAYAAFIDTGRVRIASASPELFFERCGGRVITRPMKGTAPRGRWPGEDDSRARALSASEKERAENLMIVDLLRNDLGRIAEPGSVRVSRLCALERHPTVWQMTSTIEARVRDGVALPEIFAALFPCGSVTGAPKVAAMRAIAHLETSHRGAYCGAIGVIRPGGDSTFSVAIRTATFDAATGTAEYGVGGGITWDSRADAEYDEALVKARVLTVARPAFGLIETLRLENGTPVRLEGHLRRLAASARYFGFADPEEAARSAVAHAAAVNSRGRHRLRIVASSDGAVEYTVQPLETASMEARPVRLATHAVDADDVLVYHKTTLRDWIDRERAAHPEVFDVLFANSRGELTELGTGNLVAELDGRRYTPALECGLLAGVFRTELVERGEVEERVLRAGDLQHASRLWLVNSLREWVPIRPG